MSWTLRENIYLTGWLFMQFSRRFGPSRIKLESATAALTELVSY